jgi:hypothetical protein
MKYHIVTNEYNTAMSAVAYDIFRVTISKRFDIFYPNALFTMDTETGSFFEDELFEDLKETLYFEPSRTISMPFTIFETL